MDYWYKIGDNMKAKEYIKRRIKVLKSMAKHNKASFEIWTECKVRISELEGVLDVVRRD